MLSSTYRMRFIFSWVLGLLFFAIFPAAVAAQPPTPVGFWRVYDDDKIPRGVIKISEVNGQLRGVIVQSFPVLGQTPQDRCVKCKGALYNKPIVGMTVLWGLKKADKMWRGGYVLNPYKGKTYSASLWTSDDNRILHVRGYIAVSLLGITFEWVRVAP